MGYVFIDGGINDPEATVAEITAGLRQLVDRAHAASVLAIGETIPPCEATRFPTICREPRDGKAAAVNEWIRTSGAFDAVVDWERVLRDPAHPTRILPAYDSGDHAHPNDAGYAAMADAVDLALLRARPPAPAAR